MYGRLSSADQHKVFSAHTGRRIVLATNVAETSLTVPGIRYVIDPGTARISRYSPRSKVQRLPIEPISQASAGQRAGRCCRVADGICIRLYSERDLDQRPAYTDPEIARTSLASVILQMAALELGDIADFPFLDPPDRRQITDGVTVLTELGALDRTEPQRIRLTPTGRAMADLPLDPRLARILVEGQRLGCLREMLVLAAALSVIDVREYPLDERDKATAAHARFVDAQSDFTALLSLWVYLDEQAQALSGNAFRRLCRREYLNYLRIREWQDLHAQLSQLMDGDRRSGRRRGRDRADRALAAQAPRRSVRRRRPGRPRLAGRGRRHRAGAHGVAVRPALAHRRRKEGTRVPGHPRRRLCHLAGLGARPVRTATGGGRRTGGDQPAVGTDLRPDRTFLGGAGRRRAAAPQLLRATVERETGERGGHREGDPARRDPVLHRAVRPDRPGAVPRTVHPARPGGAGLQANRFFADNQRAREQVAEWEERARRRDILVDDDTMVALYDARIPAEVTSGRHFDSWWKKASRTEPDLLTFTPDMLIAAGADRFDSAAFPDQPSPPAAWTCRWTSSTWPGRRRGHGQHPAGRARPGRPGRLQGGYPACATIWPSP